MTGMSLRLAVVPLVSANISTRLSASKARVSPACTRSMYGATYSYGAIGMFLRKSATVRTAEKW